ncbi:MAG TPA: lactose transporter [Streptococcus parasuis]|nr:lactose transporter [Streptococcus parasuis]
MSETKYHFRREGNHFKLSSSQNRSEQAERPTPVQPIAPKRVKRSIWSRIGSFFGILFSGIVMIFGFLIASIGFAIFWVIAYIVYDTIVLNNSSLDVQPFNNTVILTIMALGLIASIFVTIAQIRE